MPVPSPEISAYFYDLSPVLKCVLFPAALLLACSILRVIANNLPSQRPPVFEGVPFIGGVLKFVQVQHHKVDVLTRVQFRLQCAILLPVHQATNVGWPQLGSQATAGARV